MAGIKSVLLPVLLLGSGVASAVELPLFADEARKQGYSLPEPFGLSVAGLYVEQDFIVDRIGFSGLSLGTLPLAPDAIGISAAPGQQHSEVYTLRADVWLLPFLNLYAIGGKMV
ncbi:MAG: hypothetical protein ACRC7Q_05795, partial [Plesiomonas shigelloides]